MVLRKCRDRLQATRDDSANRELIFRGAVFLVDHQPSVASSCNQRTGNRASVACPLSAGVGTWCGSGYSTMRRKLTPGMLEQVLLYVEQGLSAVEIAEMVGCTVGTLRVTCSKHQISLKRRPTKVK